MTAAVLDTVGLAHLVAVVQRCRPDWNPPGIRRALETALGRHPYPDVAVVAVASARDRTARTPAVIAIRCDLGWIGNTVTEPPTRTPPNAADMRCPHCDAWLIGDETRTHNCRDRADPEVAAAYATAARTAAKDAARPKEGVPDELVPYVDEEMFKEVE